MKIYNYEKPWDNKVNFVDENNVILGYRTPYGCCERYGWYLSDKRDQFHGDTFEEKSMTLDGWVFDPNYFEGGPEAPKGFHTESASTVQFRIVNGDQEKFITLYNCHNGYYSKGFKFEVPSEPSKNHEGDL